MMTKMWRKKALFLLLILGLSTFTLFAASKLEVSSIELGMSNDLWSNGLSRNDDDQDSFALFSKVNTNLGWLRLDSHAITNRGWREGWEPGNDESQGTGALYRGRYDDLELFVGHTFSFPKEAANQVYLSAEAGVSMLGKLGQEFLQNGLHQIAGIHGVDLPYDMEKTVVRPALNLESSYSQHIMRIGRSSLDLELNAKFYASFSLFYQENLSASLILTGPSGDRGYLSLGHNLTQVTSGYPTQELLGRYLNAPEFSFGFKAGAILLDYSSYTITDYGMTRITVDLMGLQNMGYRRAQGRKDIPKAFAAYSFTQTINYVSVGFEQPIEGKQNWSLIAIDHYTAGTPISTVEEKNSDTFTEPRKKINDVYLTAGVKRIFGEAYTSLVDCYLYGTGGLAVLRYDELRNMIDTPEYTEPCYSWHNIRPCLNMGFGIQSRYIDIPYIPIPPFDVYTNLGFVLTPGVTKTTPTGVNLRRSIFHPYWEVGVAINLDL